MSIITKKYPYILTSLIVTLITNGMEKSTNYSQLQLQNSSKKNQLITMDCQAWISRGIRKNKSVTYLREGDHTNIFQKHNLQSTISDPAIVIQLQSITNNSEKSFIRLPLKYCINLNNDSKLQIIDMNSNFYIKTDSNINPKLFSKPTPILINATCTTNPELPGKNFAEQMNNAQQRFYEKPAHHIQMLPNPLEHLNRELKEYEEKGIIIDDFAWTDSYNRPLKHGINGCSNEKIFQKSAISTKIPNASVYKSLKRRELTGSFK